MSPQRLDGRALAGLFALAAVLALLAAAPLSLVLGERAAAAGLSAQGVSGTVWRGRLQGASFRDLPLGEVRLGLNPFVLLIGRVHLGFSADQAKGTLRLAPQGAAFHDMHLTAPTSALAPQFPLSGLAEFSDLSLDVLGGACRRAGGQVRLSELALDGAPLPGLVLSGAPACADGAVRLPLSGQAEGVDVQADLIVRPDGAYQLTTTLRTTRPELDAVLTDAGYVRGLDGYSRTQTGRLGR